MSPTRAAIDRRRLLLAGLCSSWVWTLAAPHRLQAETLEKLVAQRADELRERLAGSDFQIVTEGPFVVIGNEPAARVEQRARGTLRWAYRQLQSEYLSTTAREPIVIWICRDADSYERTSREQLKIDPESPFGFFSPTENTILVNIATGSGTLVHELVHSLIAVDFPDCPAWFNEGLASLYEQCEQREGQIWGLPNWRLRSLQKSIADRRTISFEQLCHQGSDRDFLSDNASAYAQARYLCLYLQDHGLLRSFYRTFRERRQHDPTGYRTLVDVLGQTDMATFQEHWAQWVCTLKEPNQP